MWNYTSKYSQGFVLAGSALVLIFIIFFGQRLLGDKGEVAALAGFITIFGVSTNNLVQAIGRRKREKAKREFEVRRDIYLEFAEGIAKNWARLAKLLRFDIAEKDLHDSAHDFIAAGNKVRIVGSAKTVEYLETLFKEFTKFELRVRQERLGINARIDERKQIDEQFRKNNETMSQINAYLQNMQPSGFLKNWTDADKTQIQNMRQQFGNLNTHNTTLIAKRQILNDELITLEKEYRNNYILGISHIRPFTTEMLLSIRVELDVSIDEDWYRKLSESVDSELRREFERVIEQSTNPRQAQEAKSLAAPQSV